MKKSSLQAYKPTSLQAYKPKPQLLLVLCLSLFSQFCFAQANKEHDKTLTEKSVIPLNNEIIVKFNPDIISKIAVNDLEKQEGKVIDFIDPKFLELFKKSEFFSEKLANLTMRKVFHSLSTTDTISISRLGNEIRIPKFWSTFVVSWEDDDLEGLDVLEAIETLNNLQPYIEYAEFNESLSFCNLPNDTRFSLGLQAGLTPTAAFSDAHINMDVAWDFSTGHYSTKVGVLDSGIKWNHEDLMDGTKGTPDFSRVKGGYDYVAKSKAVIFGTFPDQIGHGTKMAGIIGAIRNNGKGVASIAGGNMNPNPLPAAWFQDGVQLYNLHIANDVTNDYLDSDAFLDACIEGASSSNIKTKNGFGFGLNVMNMSFGRLFATGIPNSRSKEEAVYYAFLNNVVMSAGAGNNDGSAATFIPSSFNDEWIMRVGASNQLGKKAAFSNTANALDFMAPGVGAIVNTLDTDDKSGYVTSGGTSSATAHVSGVSALMIGYMVGQPLRSNDLAPEDIENLLQKFADDDKAIPGYDDNTGFGKINAGNTLKGITFPRFQVRHYSKGFTEKDVTVVATGKKVAFSSPIHGVIWQSTGDEYEVSFKIDIKQASGRKILDVWALNSMSDVFDGYNKNPFKNKLTLVSWDQNTAVVKGIVYYLKVPYLIPNPSPNQGPNSVVKLVPQWVFPHENSDIFSDKHKVAITVYSEDASVTNTLSTSIDETHLRISPNPSNGNFNILFGLLKDTKMGIQVTDLSGKTVYSEPLREELEGHKEISLDLNHLNNGMYLCNIITNEGVITRKIIIIH